MSGTGPGRHRAAIAAAAATDRASRLRWLGIAAAYGGILTAAFSHSVVVWVAALGILALAMGDLVVPARHARRRRRRGCVQSWLDPEREEDGPS